MRLKVGDRVRVIIGWRKGTVGVVQKLGPIYILVSLWDTVTSPGAKSALHYFEHELEKV